MNLGRRVILVIALGAALVVLATTVSSLLVEEPDSGWFMYQVGDAVRPLGTGMDAGDHVVVGAVWLVAVAIWFAIAWWLFRPRRE